MVMNSIEEAYAALQEHDFERARKIIGCRDALGGRDYANDTLLGLCDFVEYGNTGIHALLVRAIEHAKRALPNVPDSDRRNAFYTHFVLARAYTFLATEPEKRKEHYARAREFAEKSGLGFEADWIKTLEVEDA